MWVMTGFAAPLGASERELEAEAEKVGWLGAVVGLVM